MPRLDPFSPEKRSEVMRAVGRTDTAAEMKLRGALWRAGLRYRVHRAAAGTRPDLCFVGKKVAVFVDGCFWHGCPKHYSAPVANAEFWRCKLERNIARDRCNDRDLQEVGWSVRRYWECEINEDLDRVVEDIASTVR